MTFAPVLTTAPATLPVTRAEVKLHLRVDHDEEDSLIDGLIAAGVQLLDGWSGALRRALMTQTWRQDFECFSPVMRLPLFPTDSITSVTYIDAANAQQTAAPALYELLRDGLGDYVALKPGQSWPATGDAAAAVSITYVAGESAWPAPVRAALLLMIGDLYRNRETVAIGPSASSIPMSATVDALLAPYRRLSF
jgi:uncharacterized phiE125 gp8 family phage protein